MSSRDLLILTRAVGATSTPYRTPVDVSKMAIYGAKDRSDQVIFIT